VPAHIQKGLKEAADQVTALDYKMASLNKEVNILKEQDIEETSHTPDMQKYIQQFIAYNTK